MNIIKSLTLENDMGDPYLCFYYTKKIPQHTMKNYMTETINVAVGV